MDSEYPPKVRSRRQEVLIDDSRAHNTYHRVTLPNEIERIWNQNAISEGVAFCELQKRTEKITGTEIRFIQGQRAPSDREGENGVYKIWNKGKDDPRPRLTFPSKWEEWFLDSEEFPEYLMVEVLTEPIKGGTNEYIRVYPTHNYQYRKDQLIRQNNVPDLELKSVGISQSRKGRTALIEEVDGYTDLSSLTEYKGQKFQIIPFDGGHEIFESRVSGLEASDPHGLEFFNEVREEEGFLPNRIVPKMTVWWVEDIERRSRPDTLPRILYEDFYTENSKVILPRRGGFLITVDYTENIVYSVDESDSSLSKGQVFCFLPDSLTEESLDYIRSLRLDAYIPSNRVNERLTAQIYENPKDEDYIQIFVPVESVNSPLVWDKMSLVRLEDRKF